MNNGRKQRFSKGTRTTISSTTTISDGIFRFSHDHDHDDAIYHSQFEVENDANISNNNPITTTGVTINNNDISRNNNDIVNHSDDALPSDNRNHIVNNNDDDDVNDYYDDSSTIPDADIHHHSLYQQKNRYSCYVGIAILILSLYAISITILYWNNVRFGKIQQQQMAQSDISKETNYGNNRFSILLNITIPNWKSLPLFDTQLTQIVFGSCAQQNVPQVYWDTILSTYSSSPDMFLLMGDNIYGDCSNEMYEYNIDGNNYNNNDNIQYNECIELKIGYQIMANHPSIIGAATKFAVLPTLDDHDYGINDCHMYNPFKDIAKQYFIEFFNIPTKINTQQCSSVGVNCGIPLAIHNMDHNDDHNDEIKDGVFRSGIWGTGSDLVQIIILDTRYWRSPFIKTGNSHSPYTPYTEEECTTSNNTTMKPQILSNRQWIWLEEQMKYKATIRFIISSIQVLNNTTGFECWRHIPTEQRRLYNIIYKTTINDSSRTILLSGDRHVGGYYEYHYKPTDSTSTEYVTISEITSSSLTHSEPYNAYHPNCTTSVCADEYDPNRITDFIRENMFGTISINWTNSTINIDLRKADNSYGATYHGPNTGVVSGGNPVTFGIFSL